MVILPGGVLETAVIVIIPACLCTAYALALALLVNHCVVPIDACAAG